MQEEFEAVMLPRHRHKRGLVGRNKDGAGKLPYKRLAPKGTLPGAVDWRGSAAESIVKDQAACGSCWAFGATGTLEAAHYLATGGPPSPPLPLVCNAILALKRFCTANHLMFLE